MILEIVFRARKDGLESGIILNKKLLDKEKLYKNKLFKLEKIKKQTVTATSLTGIPCICLVVLKGYIPIPLSILSIIILLLNGAIYKKINSDIRFTKQTLIFIKDARETIINDEYII